MTRKYNTRCWFCGSTDLEPDARGIICRKCGTTYNVIPKPGSDPITMQKDPMAPSYSSIPNKSPSPIRFSRAPIPAHT
ncbi:hypothetical protein ES703_66532 [subsurface metagenome]